VRNNHGYGWRIWRGVRNYLISGTLHIQWVQTTRPNNDWKEGLRGKQGGRDEIHCVDHDKKS
jgi:hypothetical protein